MVPAQGLEVEREASLRSFDKESVQGLEEEGEEEGQTMGPWVNTGYEPGYLNQAVIEEGHKSRAERKMYAMGKEGWRVVAEYFLGHIVQLVEGYDEWKIIEGIGEGGG